MTKIPQQPLRVGVGGPVGSGKTTLVEMLCKAMRDRFELAVVTNDIYTKEDERCRRCEASSRAHHGRGTGGPPRDREEHRSTRSVARMRRAFRTWNRLRRNAGIRATLSPELRSHALRHRRGRGEKIRERAGGHPRADLLIINKIDLAPYVGASLDVMAADTRRMRGSRPFVFTNLKARQGVDEVVAFIEREGLLGV